MSLRIHVHDNSGHPFQVQLSRALAGLGHTVHHTYMASFQTPKGRLALQPDDPAGLRIEGIDLGKPFPKYAYLRRWQQERRYGHALAAIIERDRPDVLLASNTPLEMLDVVQAACRRHGVRFVFWVQDLYGYAIAKILGPRYFGLGRLVGQWYLRKERRLLAASDHAVAITEDFRPFLREAGLDATRVSVIPNWAPLEEMPRRPKDNAWSRTHGLHDRFVFLYSGTLGLKHNPDLLLALAEQFRDDPRVQIVVVSEGLGADWLRDAARRSGVANLVQLPFQPFDAMPEVLASADALVAVLEDSAGVFSVPSKILSYLCAGRGVLLAAPPENQATQLIAQTQSGLVCPSGDRESFLAAARTLAHEPDLLRQMGDCARREAEYRFNIVRLVRQFEQVLGDRVPGGKFSGKSQSNK